MTSLRLKKYIFCVVASLALLLSLVGCGSGSSSYSSTYRNDSDYRSNVDKIASDWGVSSEEVDSKITAITEALND